jgi:hypothetical protein
VENSNSIFKTSHVNQLHCRHLLFEEPRCCINEVGVVMEEVLHLVLCQPFRAVNVPILDEGADSQLFTPWQRKLLHKEQWGIILSG